MAAPITYRDWVAAIAMFGLLMRSDHSFTGLMNDPGHVSNELNRMLDTAFYIADSMALRGN